MSSLDHQFEGPHADTYHQRYTLVEQLQDEMADLMDIGNDIQESISRSYDIPDGISLRPFLFLWW